MTKHHDGPGANLHPDISQNIIGANFKFLHWHTCFVQVLLHLHRQWAVAAAAAITDSDLESVQSPWNSCCCKSAGLDVA